MEVPSDKIYELFNYCYDQAKSMLQEAGGFNPFGALLTPALELNAVRAELGDAQPDQKDIYQALDKALQEQTQNNDIVASALACDVNIPEKHEPPSRDGLRVHVVSQGLSRYIYVPYQIESGEDGNDVTFFEPFTVDLHPHILGDLTQG